MLLSRVSSVAAGALPLTGPAVVWAHGRMSSFLNPGAGSVDPTDPVCPPLCDRQAGQVLEQTSATPLGPGKRRCGQQARLRAPHSDEMGVGVHGIRGEPSSWAWKNVLGLSLPEWPLEESRLPLPTKSLFNLRFACSREFFILPRLSGRSTLPR